MILLACLVSQGTLFHTPSSTFWTRAREGKKNKTKGKKVAVGTRGTFFAVALLRILVTLLQAGLKLNFLQYLNFGTARLSFPPPTQTQTQTNQIFQRRVRQAFLCLGIFASTIRPRRHESRFSSLQTPFRLNHLFSLLLPETFPIEPGPFGNSFYRVISWCRWKTPALHRHFSTRAILNRLASLDNLTNRMIEIPYTSQ